MTKTEKVLYGMFIENTGKSIFDSGGTGGRHWEENKGKTFQELSALFPVIGSIIRPNKREVWLSLDMTKNTLNYLAERLEYNEKWDKKFHKFAEKHPQVYWTDLEEMFVDDLKEKGWTVSEEYGGNTYDGDSALSQVFQWSSFSFESPSGNEESVLFLQIHGGCDIRGGYSTVHLFTEDEPGYIGLFGDLTVRCDKCRDFYANSDNGGYSFYETTDVDISKCGAIIVSEEEVEKVILLNKAWLGLFKKSDLKELKVKFPYTENLFLNKKESKLTEFKLYVKTLAEKIKEEFANYDLIAGENGVYLPIVDREVFCPLCGSKLIAY